MKQRVSTGLDNVQSDPRLLRHIEGRVGYLCHSASVDAALTPGIAVMKQLLGDRLRLLFSPQHGLATDAQDNMIESPHFFHQHYQLPVYSLYAETRFPTPAMLSEIDHLVIDLQDNGARVYTYIWTMVLALEACAQAHIPVTVLDRPNPLGGQQVEGNLSSVDFQSFIGWQELPMRHGMTMGEIARFACRHWNIQAELRVIPMQAWQRAQLFEDTGLPWVLPSPNFPSLDTARVYPGTVLFEGTSLSEGRGSVRPFELIGHPQLSVYAFIEEAHRLFDREGIAGCRLRPAVFVPTFDKFAGEACQAFQLHLTEPRRFQAWRCGQWLLWLLYDHLGPHFSWRQPPFEYVYDRLPIDLLNGSDAPRLWIEQRGDAHQLDAIEQAGLSAFLAQREAVLMYD